MVPCTSINSVVYMGIWSLAAAMHYELLVQLHDACPLPMLVGESETGKCSTFVTFMQCIYQVLAPTQHVMYVLGTVMLP